MLRIASKQLPSLVSAHLRSPAAFPALSVAVGKVASSVDIALAKHDTTMRNKSTAVAHDESLYDSYYHHSYEDGADHPMRTRIANDMKMEILAEQQKASRVARQQLEQGRGLLSPCGTIRATKFSPEGPSIARDVDMEEALADHKAPHKINKSRPPPHSDLTHLEDPYHQYAYYPDVLPDLPNISSILQHENERLKLSFNIIRDDAKGTTIEMDVANYDPHSLSAQIENGHTLHLSGKSNEGKQLDRRFSVGPDIDEDNVTATLEDGVLTVKVPKIGKDRTKVRDIAIAEKETSNEKSGEDDRFLTARAY